MKIKHNKYWFVPKSYGWGFVPISWEGWVSTTVLLVFCLISAYTNNIFSSGQDPEVSSILRFLFDLSIIVAVSFFIFKPKTKGKIRWHWGK